MNNLTAWAFRHKAIIHLLLAVMLLGGVAGFLRLGKREDALFTIKSAALQCHYPGASPEQVEALITEPIEREIQSMRSLHKITSKSLYGGCQILVELDPATPTNEISQLWDELRRRCEDVAPRLPDGASEIEISDDYGALYGLYYALVAAPGFDNEELRRRAQEIKLSLQEIDGVERITLLGEQQPAIGVYLSSGALAGFSIRPERIVETISQQNRLIRVATSESGEFQLLIPEEGSYQSLEQLRDQLLISSDGRQYRLGDIARIEREPITPPSVLVRVDGEPAIGIGISTSAESDVVQVGRAVRERLDQLQQESPIGLELRSLYPEDLIAREATNDFLLNLLTSLLIVVGVIILIMGPREGVVIGSSLLFAIGGTLLLMQPLGESLNRTSLAGFIIAMGMLVDNAIVVIDYAKRRAREGYPLRESLCWASTATSGSLLGATAIAILSFLPLYLAPSSVAEIIKPLFVVVALSLLLSWLLALVQTPLFGERLIGRAPQKEGRKRDWEVTFDRLLLGSLRHRWLLALSSISLFALSLWGFSKLPQNFFPNLSKPYFRADILLPEGYDIEATAHRLDQMQQWLSRQAEVKQSSYTAGATPPRYYLASAGVSQRPNFGNLLVELHNKQSTAKVEERFARYVADSLPDLWLRSSLFRLSPVPDAAIEFGFIGPNLDTLIALTARAEEIMWRHGGCQNIRQSVGNRLPLWLPVYSQMKGQRIGISRSRLADGILTATNGYPLGSYREGDRVMPILLKLEGSAGGDPSTLEAQPIFSPSGKVYTIGQAIESFRLDFRHAMIEHYNRQRIVKAQCDPQRGWNTKQLFRELRDSIERIPLPEGYRMRIFGEEENQSDSNRALAEKLPLTLFLIVTILLLLFNNYRDPLLILGMLPLILIGVVAALAITGEVFNFFSLLGLLGLVGMSIKNSIVLISEIKTLKEGGMAPDKALVQATRERAIPVITASITTILGMIPLLFDPLFASMAATIMGGLLITTLLTIGLLPPLYALLYHIQPSQS